MCMQVKFSIVFLQDGDFNMSEMRVFVIEIFIGKVFLGDDVLLIS